MRFSVILLVAALTCPNVLATQTVRGQLTDSVSRAPLPGAFLTLVDEKGVERARTITNGAGEFLLSALPRVSIACARSGSGFVPTSRPRSA